MTSSRVNWGVDEWHEKWDNYRCLLKRYSHKERPVPMIYRLLSTSIEARKCIISHLLRKQVYTLYGREQSSRTQKRTMLSYATTTSNKQKLASETEQEQGQGDDYRQRQ
jgi:hypothetical protein